MEFPPPPSIPSPEPEHGNGISSHYSNAPRTQGYNPSPANRPPPLASEIPQSSRWAPRSPANIQPPGLPDFTNFNEELDNLKYGLNFVPPTRSNPSRASGRGSAAGFSRASVQQQQREQREQREQWEQQQQQQYQQYQHQSPLPPPPIVITSASSPRTNSQRTSNASIIPPSVPSPAANPATMPSTTPKIGGVGLGGFGLSRFTSFLRPPGGVAPASAPAPAAPVHAPVPAPSVAPSPAPAPAPAPRTSSRAGGSSSRPGVSRVGSTLGVPHSVPMAAPVGSPQRPPVIASKPPPQQPKQFPLTRPNTRFTDRNQNKTRAMVEAFQAMRDEQDQEKQRNWNAEHGVRGGFEPDDAGMDQSRPPSRGSVRSKKSRAVTVVSTSDEDDWTTGRSLRGRL